MSDDVCLTCGGGGWATAYREGYDGSPVRRINGRSVAMWVATPCLCHRVRWVLERIRETDPDSRLKDLAICMPKGWTLEDPTVSMKPVR